jgi:PAS domain S-box-containing protein
MAKNTKDPFKPYQKKINELQNSIRKQAKIQSRLLKQEKILSSVFKVTKVGICITNEKGLFVNVNNAYCKIYGYKKSELIGKPFTLVVPDENKKQAQKLHDIFILTGKEIPLEWIVQRKDGQLLNIVVTGALLLDDDGNRFKVTTVTDITLQKQSEALINRFTKIVDKSYNEIYIFDAKCKKILSANSIALLNSGYTLSELKKLSPLDLAPKMDSRTYDQKVHSLRSRKLKMEIFETVHQRKDKSTYTVEVRLQYMDHESPPVFVAIVQDNTERKKLYRMQEELRLAREIQAGLGPKQDISIKGYDIARKSIPSLEVSGDYYDFIEIDQERTAICLGDISGKGMPAALLMSNLQAAIRGYTYLDSDITHCIQFTNKLLYYNTSPDKFATFFYGILSHNQHRLQFINAGHDPPLLFSPNKQLKKLTQENLILGFLENFEFKADSLDIKSGQVLVLFSDGITEAMNKHEEEFGEKRLIEIIGNNLDKRAAIIADKIIESVQQYIGSIPQMDDITLLVLKRL